MYKSQELANFAMFSFERALEGDLTDKDASSRLVKADGTQMNAISWIVGHVSWQWVRVATRAALAKGETEPFADLRKAVYPFRSGSDVAAPPPLANALDLFRQAKATSDWVALADEAALATVGSGMLDGSRLLDESLGTGLMRTVLHTWFHIGEINAIRQMLGHPSIGFVGPMNGKLEWHPPA